jgi:GNAT superfamily N-acetyltransferase
MIEIRKATVQDGQDISRVVCQCYEGFQKSDDWPTSTVVELIKNRGSTDCIRNLIDAEQIFIAVDGNTVKGMISISTNEITKLYVDAKWHGTGIGRQLFRHAERFIQDTGHKSMFLGAAVESPVPFYRKMGMRVLERRLIDCGPCSGMTSIVLDKLLNA